MNLKLKRIYQISLFIIYIALLVFFAYESLKDGTASGESSNRIGNIIASIIEFFTGKEFVITDRFNYLIRKFIGHFSYFVLLGCISCLFYSSFSKKIKDLELLSIVHFATGLMYAFMTEFLFQMIAVDRMPSLLDVFIDYFGFIFLSVIILKMIYFKNFLKKLSKTHSEMRINI